MLHKVLNESGEELITSGADDFGDFVLANLAPNDAEDKSGVKPSSAAHLLDRLVVTFSAFDDHQVCRGEPVYFLKRAQLAIASVYRRFKVCL